MITNDDINECLSLSVLSILLAITESSQSIYKLKSRFKYRQTIVANVTIRLINFYQINLYQY